MPSPPDDPCFDCDLHNPVPGGMMGMGMDRMGEMMGICLANAKEVGLSPEQIGTITPIHREMQKLHIRFRADLQIAEMNLKDIMDVRDFDLDKASAAVKKIADIKASHHLDMLKSMKEARSVLTDEQFGKMKELMAAKMKSRMPGKKMMRKSPRR
jgi:Spy/CpxP family protein refolding chaperone